MLPGSGCCGGKSRSRPGLDSNLWFGLILLLVFVRISRIFLINAVLLGLGQQLHQCFYPWVLSRMVSPHRRFMYLFSLLLLQRFYHLCTCVWSDTRHHRSQVPVICNQRLVHTDEKYKVNPVDLFSTLQFFFAATFFLCSSSQTQPLYLPPHSLFLRKTWSRS